MREEFPEVILLEGDEVLNNTLPHRRALMVVHQDGRILKNRFGPVGQVPPKVEVSPSGGQDS